MDKLISKNIEEINYESEILEYIKNNPGGVSITDIANEKGYSRNTVSKYLNILKLKDLVKSKKIGTTKLFHSVGSTTLPKDYVILNYKLLLKSIKKHFPNKHLVFKEIGKELANNLKFAIGKDALKQIDELIYELKDFKPHFFTPKSGNALKNLYSSYDIYSEKLDFSIISVDYINNKAVFRIKNSPFLEESEDYIYHIYISCGFLEANLMRHNIKTECNVEKINIDKNIENSYFDLSIIFKQTI